jgi:hypothetical protein
MCVFFEGFLCFVRKDRTGRFVFFSNKILGDFMYFERTALEDSRR